MRIRRSVKALAVVVAAVATFTAGTGVARADTINQTPHLHQVWRWSNCTIDVGFVPDRYAC